MQPKEYPSIEVETKYGKLTLTFTSPSTEMQRYHIDGEYKLVPVYSAVRYQGALKINGVEIDASGGAAYVNTWDKDQKRVVEFRTDHQRSYNRRKDRGAWDYNAGYAKKFHEAVETEVRAAYEARPDLIAQAEKVRLHNVAADAYQKIEEAEAVLRDAKAAYAKALAAK